MHTLIIANLDDFEATHIAEILSDYKSKILCDIIKALSLKKQDELEWYERHLAWHEEIMSKVKWTKE